MKAGYERYNVLKNACFFFYILFGKNLDTFVMDFSRDRRKTPSAVGDYMHTCISLYVVSVVMYVIIALRLIMNHTKILSGSSANFSVNFF